MPLKNHPSPRKGKTVEEIYGQEKGKQFRAKQRVRHWSEKTHKKLFNMNKGKTYEQIQGSSEKAKQRKAKQSASWTQERKAKQSQITAKLNKERKWTEESRKKSSNAHKGKPTWLKGRHHTEETKKTMVANSGRRGKIPWNKGVPRSEEERRKMSIGLKKHSKFFSEQMRKMRPFMHIPKKDTSIEVAVQKELTTRGISYAKHYPVKGQPDIAFPEQKIAIFFDGKYWHSLEAAKKNDCQVNEFLQKIGWIVLRFSETEIKKDVKQVVDDIQTFLDSITYALLMTE